MKRKEVKEKEEARKERRLEGIRKKSTNGMRGEPRRREERGKRRTRREYRRQRRREGRK